MDASGMSARQAWSAIASMSICAFALVASEFLPVSLLTPIARERALSDGQAGQAISISGFFAVATSLCVARLTRRLDRKPVMLAFTAMMCGSGVAVALAPNHDVLMAARAVLGMAIGGYWSMSTAVMMRFAPAAILPRAIAVMQGGSALATAVAAPLGSYLGGLVGWRGAFFCVVPLALAALAWQAVALPRLPAARDASPPRGAHRLLATPVFAVGLGALVLLFMGQFTLYTYLRPFLESVTRVNVSMLSAILLCIGLCGLAGTMAVGRVIARSLHGVLIAIPVLMSAIAVALVGLGASVVPTLLLLAAWGLISTSAPVGWFTWLSRTLPRDVEAGGGLMVAAIQFAITVGATAGGVMYDAIGHVGTFLCAAGLLLAGALAAGVVARMSRAPVRAGGEPRVREAEFAD